MQKHVLTEIILRVVAENGQTMLLPCMFQRRQKECCIHSKDYSFAKALWTSFFHPSHHQMLYNNDSPEQNIQMAKALQMGSGCLALELKLADYILF